jgi:hypothetical protein
MRNISDKNCRERERERERERGGRGERERDRQTDRKHILCSITFFCESLTDYEIMYNNLVKPGRLQNTVLRMRIACWIQKAINTHS